MQTLASFAAKAALMAAAGAGLYVASNYSDHRAASNWTISAASSEPKEPAGSEPARATSSSQHRLMAKPGSCASETWPHISPECITGEGEPAKVAERPAIVPEQSSTILLRPTKLPAAPDPDVTGSLAASERMTVSERQRPMVAKAKNRRERPVTAKSTKAKAEQWARAERQLLREAGRRNRSVPMIAVAERSAAQPAERASDPIQFRLAEGNR
jgi:hypothetical protein